MSFDPDPTRSPDHLLASAAEAARRLAQSPANGVLVVLVVRPDEPPKVVDGGGIGILRAAVSVAAAAGTHEAWSSAPSTETVEVRVQDLPEVVATTAHAAGVRLAHVGRIVAADEAEIIAMWFEDLNGVASVAERRSVLAALATAAERERQRRADHPLYARRRPAPVETTAAPAEETTEDAEDVDPLVDLLDAAAFGDTCEAFDGDEAAIMVIDIDEFAELSSIWGEAISELVVREVAIRLLASRRQRDVLARLSRDRFALLFGGVDRSTVLQVAKRFSTTIGAPLPVEIGPGSVTATIGVSHQSGLVDIDELIESAGDAVDSGKAGGGGRVVIAD
ncbi:MAG: diguanylate cyclase domain-containing protein [Ilumatobacteraceae bacterium]